MKDKFEQGEKVEVSDHREKWHIRTFVVKYNDMFYVGAFEIEKYSTIMPWKYCRKIKPDFYHYTQESFPKGEVWIKPTDSAQLITSVGSKTIYTAGGSVSYLSMHDYEISTDGRRTWHKAVIKAVIDE